MHALCLPLGASVSLLVMFFFFDSMQMLFAVCTAIIATVALGKQQKEFNSIFFFINLIENVSAFLLLPMCQYIIRPCSDGNRISFGFCGRFTAAELFSFSLAVSIVCIWVLTGHWLLMDGMCIKATKLFSRKLTTCYMRFFVSVLQQWAWGYVWHLLRLYDCQVWKCRRYCWRGCCCMTYFGCSFRRTYSAQMWWLK